ncbi:VOC family protein [Brevibacillus invocatus]|uniref:VOC family protein n=1 Tax=Brevibacillus invocatus TaxID=173959 RepID=UPI0039F10F71
MAFFTELGFAFNPQFTDEKATCMIINDNIFVLLLVESFFQTFTKKEVADASASTEVILALSAKSREEVDSLVQKALAAGGKASNDCSRSSTHLGRWRFQSVFAKWYMNRSRGSKSGFNTRSRIS